LASKQNSKQDIFHRSAFNVKLIDNPIKKNGKLKVFLKGQEVRNQENILFITEDIKE
jgi:hypothetical protein